MVEILDGGTQYLKLWYFPILTTPQYPYPSSSYYGYADYYDWLDYQAVYAKKLLIFLSNRRVDLRDGSWGLYFRLDGDRLWLQAEHTPLSEVLEQFLK